VVNIEVKCLFFQKLVIAYHVSCPHAYKQNGFLERQCRHIVEVNFSLLVLASMPLKFWVKAFLTATYVINHTPSKVIDLSTLFTRLFMNNQIITFFIFFVGLRSNLCPMTSISSNFDPSNVL
jgi:hypothetical protein